MDSLSCRWSAEDEPEDPEDDHQVERRCAGHLCARKAEIDAMLTRLQALSDEHFGVGPDEVTWGHVGSLEHYAELLKRITDMAFNEGEQPRSPRSPASAPRGSSRRGSGS